VLLDELSPVVFTKIFVLYVIFLHKSFELGFIPLSDLTALASSQLFDRHSEHVGNLYTFQIRRQA